MGNSRLFGSVQGLASLHRTLIDIQNTERAREDADALKTYMEIANASGDQGDGRLANITDIRAANLLDPNGLFLGAFEGKMLWYSGAESMLTYCRSGGGKGRDLICPALAHVKNRTLIVTDGKDGENAAISYRHRIDTLGIPGIALNPWGLWGIPNTCFNPCQIIIDLARSGQPIEMEPEELAHSVVPIVAASNAATWPKDGARLAIATVLEYLARCDPDNCNLGRLWLFFQSSSEDLGLQFAMMSTCGFKGVERRAAALKAVWKDAKPQWEAYRSEAINALAPFEIGKTLDLATRKTDFDFSKVKHTPHTIYLMVPSDKLSVAAKWISLVINSVIEIIARERGPIQTTIIGDEFAQLPASPAILKTLRVYREKGVQPWIFAQSREALLEKWSPHAVQEFEEMAGVFTLKMVQQPSLIRDISFWSGTKTILTRGSNHGGGKIQSAGSSMGETKRSVLQSEDVLGLGRSRQIIKVAGMPHPIISDSVPFYSVIPWRDQLLDVRRLHRGEYGDTI